MPGTTWPERFPDADCWTSFPADRSLGGFQLFEK